MHRGRRLAVHGGLGLGQKREGAGGGGLGRLAQAACRDDGQDVAEMAVFVLVGKRHVREPAADTVHLPPRQAHGPGELGQHGGKQPVRFRLAEFRHAQQPGKEHIPGQAGM